MIDDCGRSFIYHYHFQFFRDSQASIWSFPDQTQWPTALFASLKEGPHAVKTAIIIAYEVLHKMAGMVRIEVPAAIQFIDIRCFLKDVPAVLSLCGPPAWAVLRWPSRGAWAIARQLHRRQIPIYLLWIGHVWPKYRWIRWRLLGRDLLVWLHHVWQSLRLVWQCRQLKRLGTVAIFNGQRLRTLYGQGFVKAHTTVNCTIGIQVQERMQKNRACDDAAEGQTLRIVTVGYFDRLKKLDVLLDAVKLLITDGYDVHLDIVGEFRERPYRAWIEKHYFASASLMKHVTFHGHAVFGDALFQHYRRGDVFVHLSTWEGNPRAVMEALAMGVPVVSVPVGSVDYILAESGAGAVLAGDEADEVATMLKGCVTDRTQLAAWTARAQRLAPALTIEAQMQDLVSVFSHQGTGIKNT